MIQKTDRFQKAIILSIIWAGLWLFVHYFLTDYKLIFLKVLLQFSVGTLIYTVLNLFYVSFTYSRWGLLGKVFTVFLYLLPLVQINYYLTYKIPIDQQNINFIIREPDFIINLIRSEFSIFQNIIYVVCFGFLFLILEKVFGQEKCEGHLTSPYRLFKNKWFLSVLIFLLLSQIKWSVEMDQSQLGIRTLYCFVLMGFVSVFVFLIKSKLHIVKMLFVFLFFFLFNFGFYLSNVIYPGSKEVLTLDQQFFRSLYGAVFAPTPLRTLEQNSIAQQKYEQWPQFDLDFNVLIILNDGLRLDVMGKAGGYSQATDKELDWFLDKSYNFKYPVAVTNFTDTAIPAIFSGFSSDQSSHAIKENLTLWDYFSKSVDTFFISTQDASWAGLDKFYKSFGLKDFLSIPLMGLFTGNSELADDVLSFNLIQKYISNEKRNWFGIWQTYGNHYPYNHPPQFSGDGECSLDRSQGPQKIKNCYDNSARYVFHLENEFLKKIDLENTIVVFTSDHGEGFLEHGVYFHNQDYHQEAIRVPLIWYFPDKIKKRISPDLMANFVANQNKVVSTSDIVPTFLHLLKILKNVEIPEEPFSGKSLFESWEHRTVFSTHCFPEYRCYSRDILFVDDDYSVIFKPNEKKYFVYDTWKDLYQKIPLSQNQIDHSKLKNLVGSSKHPSAKFLMELIK